MTLEEQKLAVCEKLPELIELVLRSDENGEDVQILLWHGATNLNPCIDCRPVHWPTEGLQVCHEAERLLSYEQVELYKDALLLTDGSHQCAMDNFVERWSYEQRLEALCRVWWPERWKE